MSHTGLVDHEHVEHDVVLVDGDDGLRVHGVREARQLGHLAQPAAVRRPACSAATLLGIAYRLIKWGRGGIGKRYVN